MIYILGQSYTCNRNLHNSAQFQSLSDHTLLFK